MTDDVRAYLQGFTFGFEYLWVILLGMGIVCLLAYFVIRNIRKVEVDSAQRGTERIPTAEEFLNQREIEPSDGTYTIGEPPQKPVRKFDGNGLSTAFAEALNEKLHETIMGAKVKLNMKAPIRVRNDQMFVDVEDGEIGEIVIETATEAGNQQQPEKEKIRQMETTA